MSTQGWDFISVCSQNKLNELLTNTMTEKPARVSFSDNDTIKFDAEFGPWQITEFGNSGMLVMKLPIAKGTYESTNEFDEGGRFDLSGAEFEVKIKLKLIETEGSDKTDLHFDLSKSGKDEDDEDATVLMGGMGELTGILDERDETGSVASNIYQNLAGCLVAHKEQIAVILSSVMHAPTGGAAWLKPKASRYFFTENGNDSDGNPLPGGLAVALSVRDIDIDQLPTELNSTLMTGGYDVTVAFGPEIFLENIIKPHLGESFGVAEEAFSMQGGSIFFTGIPGVKPPLGMFLPCKVVETFIANYDPVLSSFSMKVDGERLVSTCYGLFFLTGLKDAWVEFWSTPKLAYNFDKGLGISGFFSVGDDEADYTKHIPAWEYIIAAASIPVLGPIIGIIVLSIVDSVIAAVSTGVAKAVKSSSGTGNLDGLASVAAKWPGSDDIDVQAAALADCFYVRGNI